MKRAAFIFIVFSLGLSSCIMDGWAPGISGNGQVEEEYRDVSGFTGIELSSGIDVYLSQADDFEVLVEADENLLEVIETRREGSTLVVGTDRVNIRSARSKKVHIRMPELKRLYISSAGDLIGETPFQCGDLRISISSAGDLRLEVEADKVDLDISSSGDARLAGSARQFDVSLSSAGDLYAFDLEAEYVTVGVSSAGDARVYASKEISMSASSAGNIYYKGDARVIHSSESSAGDIVKR